jgi:glycosyltransferase involved in cell wall biosynthesis
MLRSPEEVLPMKIAQIAPLYESVPPVLYGGTERIVSYLTEELVRQGHDVTLFASGDSRTKAELVPCCERALRLDRTVLDPLPHHVMMLEQLRRRAAEFDVLHFHLDYLHFPMVRQLSKPALTTLHGRLDLPDLPALYRTFPDLPMVSISAAQRQPLSSANWVGTVHHGLPPDLLPFRASAREGYLAFLGRISPEKRPDRAIQIAARAGLPLKIAAKIDKVDSEYWDEAIKPMVETCPAVEFVGEIGEAEKADFLGNARALLFPIDWPEPFGLVMIEAMSCGTPVVAFGCGSVPEIIEDGVSGFIVDDIVEAVSAVDRLGTLDRYEVRRCFERRFAVERMASRYLDLYSWLALEWQQSAEEHGANDDEPWIQAAI